MQKIIAGLGSAAAAALLGLYPAQAQNTVKVGFIMTFSGQFADVATMMDNGAKLYMKQHGDTVAGKKIEIVRKDSGTGGAAPDVAKRLGQELIVRDKVDFLAGFSLTPEALATAEVATEGKKPMVIMNAATAIIPTRSPYIVRVSSALPQAVATFGTWAAKSGIKRAYTMVSDFGPGHDSEAAFQSMFKAGGGEIVGSVRFPLASPDFSAFAQRLKDAKSEAVYIFVPGGEQPAALGKALAEHGITPKTMKILASGELVNDDALRGLGDAAEGIISAWNYDWRHKSALNAGFVKGINEALNGRNPDQYAVGGYDAMHLIYEALKKTNGNTNGDALLAAMKGLAWESPRGKISIDPQTRDIIQPIYIRRVDRIDGRLGNVEIETFDAVKDPVKARLLADGKLNPDGTMKQ
jgi:branched-chain amino acid transport system substrate-binding protein